MCIRDSNKLGTLIRHSRTTSVKGQAHTVKLEFDDVDIDTDTHTDILARILADTSDTRD